MSELRGYRRTPNGTAIEATGLAKSFGNAVAVDGVDLIVPEGTVYAILGPNGAGKTTTIRMLATLIPPDRGFARVLGHDIVTEAASVRRRISLTGQFASVDEDLTGWENLILFARLAGYSGSDARKRATDLLESFDLSDAAERQVRKYSGGMRRRLDIAVSLLVVPDLLILDEPTTGLDPASRYRVWGLIRAIVASGATVLLTTQHLDEADQLADRMAVIDHGRVIAEGTSAELKAATGLGTLKVRVRHAHQREQAAQILSQTINAPVRFESDPTLISVRISDLADAEPARALIEISSYGLELSDFALAQPSLDEVFLALTGHSANSKAASDGEAA
jgi:ABC-2 type transport system ATP-binding protein